MVDRPVGAHVIESVPDALPDIPAPLIPRGVWLTPWFYHGRRFLVVVDHTHSVIHMEPVTDSGDREAQVQSLRVMLSALDPIRLALV